jgi:hypothetical protein
MPVFAQVSGSITGTVVDATSAPLPNATVSVHLAGSDQSLFSTKTSSVGSFVFTAVRPETYDVHIDAPGFAKYIQRSLKVDPIAATSIAAKMELAATQQIVEVTSEASQVQTNTAELATTVTREQISNLPVLGRQVSNLFLTQAGVSSGRGPTVINGLRTSLANVTLDGVNVQDNFIRTNALDFQPYRTTIDQISEMTVAVGNASSAVGGGAAQIVMSTRSGSNDFHGSLYWYNRNNKVSANDWFNNRLGIQRPFLNLNQPGGTFAGRVIRDKLFFFGTYEAYRLRQQSSVLRTVLTPAAKTGVFNYLTTAGASASVNLLSARPGARIDPAIQAMIDQLPAPNTTEAGDGLRTSGYRFNAAGNTNRDQFVTRWDYYLTSKHSVTGTFNSTKEVIDRNDLGNFYTTSPPVKNDGTSRLFSGAWRWVISPTLTNELRGGGALSPATFLSTNTYPQFVLTSLIFSTPVNQFLSQGRQTDTYNLNDNANWIKGRHEVQFGFQSQFIRTSPYNDAGILPNYTLGISTANTSGFVAADLPGVRAADVAVANQLYSSLAGITSSATQTFNVKDRTSGYVPNYPDRRRFTYDTYSGYIQDRWKVNRKLTLTLGMRYEYWARINEKDSLYLLPGLINGNYINTVMSPSAVLDFAGNSVGRPFYNADRNNFAPNFGFAFDPFGSGKTVIRGGYSISYGNDDTLTFLRNNVGTNTGLSSAANIVNQTAPLSNRATVPTPAFKVPRTLTDNYAITTAGATGLPDPNLRTPYVQQWSFGIQHEVKSNIIEVRYVGNHGTKLVRALDYNQVVIKENGFLDDFRRAQSNGFLALAATGSFNATYNPAIAGSQQLTVFPRLGSGGLLTNATVAQNIREGQVGSLAEIYQTNQLNGSVNFFNNPLILGANVAANGGDSTYHALQMDLRRRLASGLSLQVNYTYSKVLSNAIGDDQNRFEPYLDNASPSLERGRAPFDLTHVIKANGFYDLPFGQGKKFELHGVADKVLGGWTVAGIMSYTSGTPFSIFSNRGTLNRGGRSAGKNTAYSSLDKAELDEQLGHVVMTAGNGPYFINPAVIGADGRGVASDGSAPFAGQIFTHPGAGYVGNLQRRMFSGPWNFNLDNSIIKRFSIGERHSFELRGDAFNVLNNPSFWVGSETTATTRFDIGQTTFGRITSTFNTRRVFQFGLYYRF